MNTISSLFGQLVTFGLVLFFIGLGISLICGGSDLAKKFTKQSLRIVWKVTRQIFKTLIGLAAEFFKWVHSKL